MRVRARRGWALLALVVIAVPLGACDNSVTGRAVRPPGEPAPLLARQLVLQEGDNTPLGQAHGTQPEDNYFTSVRPEICSAAMLFKNSPLIPPGAKDTAVAAYQLTGKALYAESVGIYELLDIHEVVWRGFSEVSDCRDDAIGVNSSGDFAPMRVGDFGIPQDNVFTWTMGRPDWTCSYGLAAVPRAALLISVCDSRPGFPMAEWAAQRKVQLEAKTT